MNEPLFWIASRFRRAPLSTAEAHRGRRTIFMCGYPLSGNSWISYMLSYSMNIAYNNADGQMSAARRLLLPLLRGENPHPGSKRYDRILKTHARPSVVNLHSEDEIIYIVRDGRDVANSYFHRIEKVWPNDKRLSIRIAAWCQIFIPWRIRYFLATRYFASLWAEHVTDAFDAGVPIVRYEDVLENAQEAVDGVITILDPQTSHEETARAVEHFTLKNMKESARKVVDSSRVTDRVGGAGNWQEYFTKRDVDWFDRKYGHLLQRLGYVPEAE